MTNDTEIVIGAKDFEIAPDVELYVQRLSNDGTLERLSKDGNLNADTIRNTPLGRMCDIFAETGGESIQAGDVIIFGDYGTFEIYTGGSG